MQRRPLCQTARTWDPVILDLTIIPVKSSNYFFRNRILACTQRGWIWFNGGSALSFGMRSATWSFHFQPFEEIKHSLSCFADVHFFDRLIAHVFPGQERHGVDGEVGGGVVKAGGVAREQEISTSPF
jgi:hypothetical protein